MARIAGRSAEEVRFGIGPLPASVALMAVFTDVLQSSSSPSLGAHVATGMVLRDMLEEGAIEFLICASGAVSPRSGLRHQPIVSLPIVPRVRRDHPLTLIETVSAADLLDYPMVGGNLFRDLSDDLATSAAPYAPAVAHDNYHELAQLVAASDAYCLFADAFQTPDLVNIAAEDSPVAEVTILLVEHEGRARTDAADDVVFRLTDRLIRAVSCARSRYAPEPDM